LEITGKGEGRRKRKKSDEFKGFCFGGSRGVFASWENGKFEIVGKINSSNILDCFTIARDD
jgi:hypothetical protein